MKSFIYIFFLFFSLALQAQVPGMQGRRFLLEYEPHWNWFRGEKTAAFTHKIRGEYAVARHVGIDAHLSYTQLFKKTDEGQTGNLFTTGTEIRYYSSFLNPSAGWGLAPLGFYCGFILEQHIGTYKLIDNNQLTNVTATRPSIGISFGERHTLTKRLTMAFGNSVHLTIPYILNTNKPSLKERTTKWLGEDLLENSVLQMYIGIGYSIF